MLSDAAAEIAPAPPKSSDTGLKPGLDEDVGFGARGGSAKTHK